MLKCLRQLVVISSALFTLHSCAVSTSEENPKPGEDTSVVKPTIAEKLYKLGYDTAKIVNTLSGYLVEGDIFLTADDIDHVPGSKNLLIAGADLYQTAGLVSPLPQVITMSVSGLPSAYYEAVDRANRMFNSLNLKLKFWRVQTGGDIKIVNSELDHDAVSGFSGFPVNGTPSGTIMINGDVLGDHPEEDYLTSLIAHELGHAIGFRHTKYRNAIAICNTAAFHAGQDAGAVSLGGQTTSPSAASWMLACNDDIARQFNANDTIALNYLYGENLAPGNNQFLSVNVLPDGTILGIGADMTCYTKSTLASPWVHLANSGLITNMTAMPDGTLLGVGTDLQLWFSPSYTPFWKYPILNSGLVTDIAILNDGTYLSVGTDKNLYTRSSLNYSDWQRPIPGSGPIDAITVMNDGTILGVGPDHLLRTRATLTADWVIVPDSGPVISVAQMADGTLLGIGTDRKLYKRSGLNGTWTLN
jgi:hypothetical protein